MTLLGILFRLRKYPLYLCRNAIRLNDNDFNRIISFSTMNIKSCIKKETAGEQITSIEKQKKRMILDEPASEWLNWTKRYTPMKLLNDKYQSKWMHSATSHPATDNKQCLSRIQSLDDSRAKRLNGQAGVLISQYTSCFIYNKYGSQCGS